MRKAKDIANLNAHAFFWGGILLGLIAFLVKGYSFESIPAVAFVLLLLGPTIIVRQRSLRLIPSIQSGQLRVHHASIHGAAYSCLYALVLWAALLTSSTLRAHDLSDLSTLVNLIESLFIVTTCAVAVGALSGAAIWLLSRWQLHRSNV